MNLGIGRCRQAFGLLGLLVATSIAAGPMVAGPGMSGLTPIAVEPAQPVDPSTQPAASASPGEVVAPMVPINPDQADLATLQQVREIVYVHMKENYGVQADVLWPAMEILTVEARTDHQVDMEVIHRVTDTILDPNNARGAEIVLLGYAEYAAFGQTIDGSLPSDAERVWVDAAKKADIGRMGDFLGRGIGGDAGGSVPEFGGVCKTCAVAVGSPDFVIPVFPPAGTYGFHSSALSGSGDCNWYRFTVLGGQRYEFRTCAPGSTSFDSVLEVYNSSCTLLTSNDDATGCGRASVVELVAPAPCGGTDIYVKISAFAGGNGPYTLAYRQETCPACTAPPMELVPDGTCRYVADCFVNCTGACLESWFTVDLVGGQGYVFTTCPAGVGAVCPLANSTPSSFDTEMFLYDLVQCPGLTTPLFTSTGTATCSAPPTNRALLSFNAPYTGQFLLRLRGPFGGAARFGCYNMGYVQTTVASCGTCAAGPFLSTLVPTATCQTVSGIVTACQDTWYLVNVPFLSNYEFSTCSVIGGCLGGSTTFDSRIELYNSSCTLLQQDDDGCGAPRSLFCTSSGIGPLSPSGNPYKLRVRGGGTGSFVMTYRSCGIPCTPPSNLTLAPTSGVASSGIGTCLKTETFFVTADGTSPMTYSFNITPPPGGTATPSSGSGIPGAPTTGNPAMIVSTLRGDGNYTVTVCATNACAPIPPPCITIVYTLRDQTKPVLVVPPDTVVPCTSVPPAPTLSADDNCDPDPVETFSERIIPGPCDGVYDIERTWEAIDRSGNTTGPIRQIVHVVDTQGPMIVPSSGVYALCMYPPNHVMHCFAATDFNPVIVDDCSGPVTWKVVGVVNSEEQLDPCGDGNQNPDYAISDDGQEFCVRSERCGNDPAENDGRVYGISIRAFDACGNASLDTVAIGILIPHDMSDHEDCIEP